MPRVINIEIMRLKPTKKTAIVMAFLALIIGCMITALPGAQAQYASAEQDRHVFTFADNLEVGVDLSEEQWAIQYGDQGFELKSGKTIVKDPVITNTKNDCYMRACIRITNEKGDPISYEDSRTYMNSIINTIWYDQPGDEAGDVDGSTAASALNTSKSYSRWDLDDMQEQGTISNFCNRTDFEEPVYNEEMKAYTMNYKDVFKAGSKVTLFNRIVIPSDMSDKSIRTMKSYYVVVWAQAIQVAGFEDSTSALEKLSNNYVPTKIPEVKATA